MSIERNDGKETFKYRSWHKDPELVKDLVTLLEAKTVDQKTGEERWKYGARHAYDVLFPPKDTEWETRYVNAPVPTSNSFSATIAQMAAGIRTFGPDIPPEIAQRFHNVTKSRTMSNPPHSVEKSIFWSNDKRIIAAGLSDYCGFRDKDIAALFKEKFGFEKARTTIPAQRSRWKKNKEFPYEAGDLLKANSPRAALFVEELRVMMGMTLEDVRNWLTRNTSVTDARPKQTDSRLERLQQFMDMHEKYSAEIITKQQQNQS